MVLHMIKEIDHLCQQRYHFKFQSNITIYADKALYKYITLSKYKYFTEDVVGAVNFSFSINGLVIEDVRLSKRKV